MAFNLNYLSEIYELPDWKKLSDKMLVKLKLLLLKFPNSFGFWSFNALNQFNGYFQITLTGKNIKKQRKLLNEFYIPNKIFQSSNEEHSFPFLQKKDYENSCKLYICSNNTCFEPQTDLSLIRVLTKN